MRKKIEYDLTLVMGKAGSGKSSMMALLCIESNKKGREVLCNHHMLSSTKLDLQDLGKVDFGEVDVSVDEAQLHYDNRAFKNFSESNKYYYSNFRHLKNRVRIFSQSFEDLDIKIRRQAHRIYIMKPSIIPFFLMYQKVKIGFGVNEDKTDIITMYKTNIFSYRFKFAPPSWRYFDSYSKPDFLIPRERKHAERWGEITPYSVYIELEIERIKQLYKEKLYTLIYTLKTHLKPSYWTKKYLILRYLIRKPLLHAKLKRLKREQKRPNFQ